MLGCVLTLLSAHAAQKGAAFFFLSFFFGGVGCREAEKSLWLANAYCFFVSTCVWIICVHLYVWLPAPNALLMQRLRLLGVTWSSLISYDCKCSRGTLLGSFKVAKKWNGKVDYLFLQTYEVCTKMHVEDEVRRPLRFLWKLVFISWLLCVLIHNLQFPLWHRAQNVTSGFLL